MGIVLSAFTRTARQLGISIVASLLFAPGVTAQVVFNVNSTADQLDENGVSGLGDGVCRTAANTCTLRAAVFEANRIAGAGTTIVLPAGTYLFTRGLTGGVNENEGDLNLLNPASGNPVIALSGAGAATTIIDANQLDRVLRVAPSRTATISGISLRNGHALTDVNVGGGILNQGTLTVSLSVVSGSTAAEIGGGILNSGYLVLDRCTLSGNVASNGAGLFNSFGTVHIIRSTISGNLANTLGGGILNNGVMFVTSSTVSGNRSNAFAGGIMNGASMTAVVLNSTIAFNEANADADPSGGTGGGIYNNGTFNLHNSVVAGNYLAGAPDYDDCTGPLNSYGHNKFWLVSGCPITQIGPGSATLLASLAEVGPLQDNGGPTLTRALRPPSSMIDGAEATQGCRDANGSPLGTDQRGAPRIAGAGCDIGAFEFGASLSGAIFAGGFEQGEP